MVSDSSKSTESEEGQMSDHVEDELQALEGLTVDRRGLLVKGGLAAAGATFLGSPAAAFAARNGVTATRIKVAVVTHGDTGSFWSVFKRGVDQAHKDLRARGVSVTQVYANNDVAKQVAGVNAAIAAGAKVIATSVPDASALKDPLTKASKKGIEIITVNSGLGAFDSLPTYEVHVGQTEDVAGKGAGKQLKAAGAKKVLIVIHEASNSGLQQRAGGVKSVLGGGGVKVLTIPNAKSDIPGTKAKVQAAFKADKSLDGFLGLDPDVTIPCLDVIPKGTKAGTFDVGGAIKEIQKGRLLFAIDQQQYLQGYLPVVFAMLFVTNLNTVGNGEPVLTGPGIINKANAAKVASLAAKGTR
jgi:simple sugar transport system substrate-binding protein